MVTLEQRAGARFSMDVVPEVSKIPISEAEALRHMGDIFRTATRLVGNRARAEDVAQDMYLQAWKSFDRFDQGTNCRAWLFKILFHCTQHRRKWLRFPLLMDSQEFVEANLAEMASVPEDLTDEEILESLDRIPADFRAVVLLVDVQELSYKEAPGIMSVHEGTVMSRLSRGRKLIREQLAGLDQSYGVIRPKQEGQ
jgi:RNA polymerase sigma-70 factor (ECF subfamily)